MALQQGRCSMLPSTLEGCCRTFQLLRVDIGKDQSLVLELHIYPRLGDPFHLFRCNLVLTSPLHQWASQVVWTGLLPQGLVEAVESLHLSTLSQDSRAALLCSYLAFHLGLGGQR